MRCRQCHRCRCSACWAGEAATHRPMLGTLVYGGKGERATGRCAGRWPAALVYVDRQIGDDLAKIPWSGLPHYGLLFLWYTLIYKEKEMFHMMLLCVLCDMLCSLRCLGQSCSGTIHKFKLRFGAILFFLCVLMWQCSLVLLFVVQGEEETVGRWRSC